MNTWQYKPLANIIEKMVTGSTPSTEFPEFFGGDVPWFTPGDIGIKRDLFESSRTITNIALTDGKARLFEPGTLLMTCIGIIGRVGILKIAGSSNQQITALKFRKEVDVEYAYYWFIAHQNELERHTNQAVVPILNNAGLKQVEFSYPPLDEQRRIAAILAHADRLRHLRRVAADLGATYLQSLFLRMFGKYLESETKIRFKDVLQMSLQNGLFEKNELYGEGIPVIWVDNLYHTISISTDNLRRVNIDTRTASKYQVEEADLLFTRSSLVEEGIGQVNIVPKLTELMLFECHIIRARVNLEKVNPYYVLELYRSDFGKTAILQRSKTATMTTIGQGDLETLPCPLPPLPLQHQFAAQVHRFERLRAQQREAERQAEHLFQTLLQRAFAGDI